MKKNTGTHFSKKHMLMILMGIVISLLAVLMVLRSGSGDLSSDEQFKMLDARLKQMEDRLINTEWLGEKLSRIEGQTEKIAPFMVRFDRLEAAVSLKIDLLEQKLKTLGQEIKTVNQAYRKAPSQQPVVGSATTAQFHQVRHGETLYRISRQYGLTLDEIQRLNPSVTGNTIYTGQRLIISSK